jgi:hypothetical protein
MTRLYPSSRRSALAAVIVAVVAAVVAASAAASSSRLSQGADAQPDPTTGSGPSTITFTPISVPGQAATNAVIVCNLTIDYPHASSHVPETVNVVAHWNCDHAMSSLEMDVYLDYGGIQVGHGHSQNTLSSSLNGNAASNGCLDGLYDGYASGSAIAPPGYTPSAQTGYVSSSAYVTC